MQTGCSFRKSKKFSFLKCANQLKWFIHLSLMVLQTRVTCFLKVQRKLCVSLLNPWFQNYTFPSSETATPAQNKVTYLLLICSVGTAACSVIAFDGLYLET